MRAPLLRLAIGLPIGLLACIALLVWLLIQSRRPAIYSRETLHLPARDSLG